MTKFYDQITQVLIIQFYFNWNWIPSLLLKFNANGWISLAIELELIKNGIADGWCQLFRRSLRGDFNHFGTKFRVF